VSRATKYSGAGARAWHRERRAENKEGALTSRAWGVRALGWVASKALGAELALVGPGEVCEKSRARKTRLAKKKFKGEPGTTTNGDGRLDEIKKNEKKKRFILTCRLARSRAPSLMLAQQAPRAARPVAPLSPPTAWAPPFLVTPVPVGAHAFVPAWRCHPPGAVSVRALRRPRRRRPV